MKNVILTAFTLLSYNAFAQVGINTSTPSTTLEVVAKNPTGTTTTVDGVIIPKVDRLRAQSMTSIPTSTLIFVNDISTGAAAGITAEITSIGFYYFDGTKWTTFVTSNNNNNWHLTGNTGTNPANNFIGTTDNQILIFKSNNINSGFLNSSGTSVGFGANSLPYNAAPNIANTAFGHNSLGATTSGNFNAAVGTNSLALNTTGTLNSGFGFQTLANNTNGTRNTGLGTSALRDNVSGQSNTAVGYQNLLITTGNTNTSIGSDALRTLTTGSNNIGLGYQAGFDSNTGGTGTPISTGSGNIMLGSNTGLVNPAGNDQMNIGNIIFGTNVNGTLANPKGNIGIGTASPETKLQVVSTTASSNRYNLFDAPAATNQYGIIALRNTSPLATGNYSLLGFTNSGPTSGGGNWVLGSIRTGATLTNGSEEDFYVGNSTGGGLTERFRIKPDTGYVGIGTSSPSARVEIASGTAGTSGLKFTNINSSTAPTANTSPLGIDASGNVVVQSSLSTSFKSFNVDANSATNSLVTIGGIQLRYNNTTCTSTNTFVQIRSTTGASNIGILHAATTSSQTGASNAFIPTTPLTITTTFADIANLPVNCVQDGHAQFIYFSYTDKTFYRINFHVADGDSLPGALPQGYIFTELQK